MSTIICGDPLLAHQWVLLPAGERAGIERLVQYMTPCPFSLSRLVKISESGQVVYKAEKQARPAFPDQHGDGIQSGLKRNYQILPPLDFLAEFIQHIPATGPHLIRYDGWYSNKSRGMRKKAGEAAGSAEEFENSSATVGAEEASSSRSRQSWAMLIKRVYEVDLLSCPECGGAMAVVAFIEPPQRDVVEKILGGHPSGADRRFASVPVGGLWRSSAARAPPSDGGGEGMEGAGCSDGEPNELTYVDMDTFLATF